MSRIDPKLACILALGLLITTAACREDSASPVGPESSPELATVAVASNTWASRARVPVPHSGFAAASAQNASGQWLVYIFGGGDAEGETGFPAYVYDVAANSWAGAGGLIESTDLNGVGKIGNKFYMTGGMKCCQEDFETWSKTWAYSPSTTSMTLKASMPRPTRAGVTGVINGQLYVLPGYCSGEPNEPGHCDVGRPIRQLYRYDPPSNTWITRRASPHFHTSGAGGVIDGKFYVVGNSAKDPSLDVYDPATNQWQTRKPIPTPGERQFGAVLQSRLFVLSWSHPSGGNVVLKAYSYNPASDTWTARAAPPGVAGPIVKVLVNGQARLFMPGGFGPSYLYTP
jgi:N-acetylneuraminic acid mutarotase